MLSEAVAGVRAAVSHAEVVTGMVEAELQTINLVAGHLSQHEGRDPSELRTLADELASHVQVIEALQRSASFGLTGAVARVSDALRGESLS